MTLSKFFLLLTMSCNCSCVNYVCVVWCFFLGGLLVSACNCGRWRGGQSFWSLNLALKEAIRRVVPTVGLDAMTGTGTPRCCARTNEENWGVAVAGERGLLWSAGSKGNQMALYGVPERSRQQCKQQCAKPTPINTPIKPHTHTKTIASTQTVSNRLAVTTEMSHTSSNTASSQCPGTNNT